jgi:cellobiose phosphorylase
MGSGDWNDGMNLVGHAGKGESVWLAFFMHHVLSMFSELARGRGDEAFAEQCTAACKDLASHIEQNAWDGKWYRRAFFDNGEPLGSASNPECQIDVLPQCWSVIAGCGDPDRSKQALESLWERLVRKDLGVIQLLDPPFDKSNLEPGYIKGYLPGVRENGGQYTHAAVWAAMGFALAGQAERALELVSMLIPINHAMGDDQVGRYKVEPYVIAADVYTNPQHPGRGGWTWYTGSAGWFYRLIHEVMLGIERRGDTMTFHPRLPASWTNFKVHYRYYQTFYHMNFVRSADLTGSAKVKVDDQPQAEDELRLINDRQEHTVEVLFR